GFSLTMGERASLSLAPAKAGDENAIRQRLSRIMGREFAEDAEPVCLEREGFSISGFAGRPTLNRPDASLQYVFVNGRPVKDRLLLSAIRGAYQDVVPRGRHPLAALFLTVPVEAVDVNVHPAKAEVRFREASLVRSLVVSALMETLRRGASVTASSIGARLRPLAESRPSGGVQYRAPLRAPAQAFAAEAASGFAEAPQAALADSPEGGREEVPQEPLGTARAQLHKTYIVSEAADGSVLIDQHAAHERIVYEKLKAALTGGRIARQLLLIPEVVEMPEEDAALLLEHREKLAGSGLVIEAFGPGAVIVRETPALLGHSDVQSLIRDLAHELGDCAINSVEARLHA
ncbi:MAG: DNA mismatch repair protein MutL, partial [Rhodomicrobium sp.]|nr:DNA mismatch repair protein MutL [Rhodomicrobium sp.]